MKNYCKKKAQHFFIFKKLTVTYFFNPMDDGFSKDNFVTKIFMETCSILSGSPEKTVYCSLYSGSRDSEFQQRTIL